MEIQKRINERLSKLNRRWFWFIILIGLICKLCLIPFHSGDYNVFLHPWVNFIQSNGYFSSLTFNFYNYTPPYIYLLILIAKTGIEPLFGIKILSIIFEYLLAFWAGKILYIKYKNYAYIWISLVIIPWIPTIMTNSALWGQCDSIYSSFVIASIYFALKEKKFGSCLMLGIAISFKLQAVFIFPFFFVLLLRKKINWYYFLLIPSVYFISILPAWFYGRPLTDLLTIYLNQASNYQALTLYLPNIYIWINNDLYEPVKITGIMITFLIVLFAGIWLSNKKFNFIFDHWIELAFLSVIITPFLLPGMHERYLYLGDVIAFMYFFLLKRNALYSIGIMAISFYAYLCCSRLKTILPVWPAFFIYLFIIIFVLNEFRKSLVPSSNQDED